MEKMKFTDNQAAFDYAIYMIASSYFAKTECSNKMLENKLLFQYKEQSTDRQIKMEEICISYMNQLKKKLPKQLFRQEMKIHFRKEDKVPSKIYFMNKDYIVCLQGIYMGKNSTIDCQLWTKKKLKEKQSMELAA